MAIATGLFKSVAYKAESAWGTAPSAGSAQYVRRVASTLKKGKGTFQSQEIQTDRQHRDYRHGAEIVSGDISGELSPLTFDAFFAAVLGASAFSSAATTGALTNVTAAAGSPPGTFTRAAGSYLTDGFKVGDIVRWTGWTSGTSAANNARNYRITGLTALIMTVGTAATGASGQPEAVVAQASGDSVTCTVVGKKVLTPTSSLADPSFAIEEWHSDVAQSHIYLGCKPTGFQLQADPTGIARITFPFLGKTVTTGTSQYYTTPTAVTTSRLLAGVNGKLSIGGTDFATVTGLSLTVAGGHNAEAVVGSVTTPGIFPGMIDVSGSLSVLFENATLRDAFYTETETSLRFHMTTTNDVNADFVSFVMPRIKISGFDPNDRPQAIQHTIPFMALNNTSGGSGINSDAATLIIQDSSAA